MAADEMEDFDAADKLATLTEKALQRRGYVTDMSRDADVVVVTQAAYVTPSGEEAALEPTKTPDRPITTTPPREVGFESVALLAMRPTDMAVGSGTPVNLGLATHPAEQDVSGSNERLRVTIKAALMKDYMRHEGTFAKVPTAWKVTIEGRVSSSQRTEFLEQALEAASVYFAQDTKTPQARRISLAPAQPPPVSVAAHSEPDLRLDPLQ
jgi:hypothetical protein